MRPRRLQAGPRDGSARGGRAHGRRAETWAFAALNAWLETMPRDAGQEHHA